MDTKTFEAALIADGYDDIAIKDYPAKPENNLHVHDFSVRGLVLSGTFLVRLNVQQVTHGPGDVFEVPEGVEHTEQIGVDGARILIGKRY